MESSDKTLIVIVLIPALFIIVSILHGAYNISKHTDPSNRTCDETVSHCTRTPTTK